MVSKKRLWLATITLFALLLLLVSIFSIVVGSVPISLPKIIQAITQGRSSTEHEIIFKVRLPRILLGLATGGGLAISGVLLQGVFRNPLVEPYTLGISGGAAFGVALAICVGLPFTPSLPLSGFLGGIVAITIVYILSTKGKGRTTTRLLLVGVMTSFVFSSLIMLTMALSKAEDLHGIVFWIMGSLQEPNTTLIIVVLIISAAGLIASLIYSVDLNALSLGEEEAFHLGVEVERTKRTIFLIASFITGCCVSVSGIIGFVGLVVPHLMRLAFGGDHRILLPTSFLSGGIFLILCDTIARVVMAPTELPVGVITGLIGGVVFIWALGKKGGHI